MYFNNTNSPFGIDKSTTSPSVWFGSKRLHSTGVLVHKRAAFTSYVTRNLNIVMFIKFFIERTYNKCVLCFVKPKL